VDRRVNDWLAETSVADPYEARQRGAGLLREEPLLPPVVAAECHLRLAGLSVKIGAFDHAERHGGHAARLAFDLPVEAQLHVLPRAVAVLRSVEGRTIDHSSSAAHTIDTAVDILRSAVQASVATADADALRLAILWGIGLALAAQPASTSSARRRVQQDATELARRFEATGERRLLEFAHQMAVPAETHIDKRKERP
jgi:hypothetical protein